MSIAIGSKVRLKKPHQSSFSKKIRDKWVPLDFSAAQGVVVEKISETIVDVEWDIVSPYDLIRMPTRVAGDYRYKPYNPDRFDVNLLEEIENGVEIVETLPEISENEEVQPEIVPEMPVQQLSLLEEFAPAKRETQEVKPGAIFVPDFLSLTEQNDLLEFLREGCRGKFKSMAANGQPMSVRVACLGWEWEPYRYLQNNGQFSGRLFFLARKALEAARIDHPDFVEKNFDSFTAIVNQYSETAKLGLHQDCSEHPDFLENQSPVITIALGLSAKCRVGSTTDKSKPDDGWGDFEMKSGDLWVLSGESRHAYHGVMGILPGTMPSRLDMKHQVRLSVSLRQSWK